jgi:hypothetical protein
MILILMLFGFVSNAQTTISTTGYTGGTNGSGSPGTGVTVSVVNANPYSIIVTQFGYCCVSAVAHELYYSATSLTGATGAVPSNPSVWTLAGTVPTPSTSSVIVDNFFSGLNVVIPPNTTYRFCVVSTTSTVRYYAPSGSPQLVYTAGGVSLDATNTVWGGSGNVSVTGRHYWGSVTFINACAGTTTLNTSNITTNSANANWNTVTGSLGYEYAITSTPTPPASGTLTSSTTASFGGLALNTTYYVHVRSKCIASFSGWQTTSFTTLNAYCLPPNNILFSNITLTSAEILWSKMPTTDYYQYTVDITKNISLPTPNTITTTGFTASATGLQPATWYYVYVRSFCLNGDDSSTWKLDSFVTKGSCGEPVVSITNPGNDPTASWPVIPEAVAYEYRVTNSMNVPAFGTEILVPTVDLHLPADGAEKFLHVRSKCNSQFSFSKWVSVPLRVHATGISTSNTAGGIFAYPNPAKDRMTIEIVAYNGTPATIIVTDMTGKQVKTLDVTNKKTELDMHDMAPGVYLLKYNGSASNEILRITKQ